jgi:hypothetical protein
LTDFRAPRSLFLWLHPENRAPYRVFFGYTPKAEELEVIAWNWQRRAFDFLLVEDYAAGKTAHVEQPPRELCMACHQDGGPIFPIAPWSESTLNTTIKQQVADQAEDPLSRYILALPTDGDSRVRDEVAMIDFQVGESTYMLQSQRICASACGGDLECRKGVLLAGLFETIDALSSSSLSSAWRATMKAGMVRSWPSDRFAIVDATISDRQVDLARPLRFEPNEDPLARREASFPLTPADATGNLTLANYGTCWSFTREQIEMLKSWGAERAQAAMPTAQMTELVTTWLPSESAIVAALADAIRAPRPATSSGSVPWTAPVDPLPNGHAAPPGASSTLLFAN